MKACNNCHADVLDEWADCPRCGARVRTGFIAAFTSLFRSKRTQPRRSQTMEPPPKVALDILMPDVRFERA
jgi:hypothetical protein